MVFFSALMNMNLNERGPSLLLICGLSTSKTCFYDVQTVLLPRSLCGRFLWKTVDIRTKERAVSKVLKTHLHMYMKRSKI